MLQVLGAAAQLERSMIRERAMAGQRGVRQAPGIAPEDETDVVSLYLSGGHTQAQLAAKFGVGLGTMCAIYRVMRPDAPDLTRL